MDALAKMTQQLIESAEYRDETARRQRIFEKWSRTSLLRKLGAKEAMDVSILLENQALALRELSGILKETTTTSDIATFNKIAFPLVRRVYGTLIAKEIVSVQPMSAPQTLVFYIDYKYVNSAGTTTGYPYGHVESDAFQSAAFTREYSAYKSSGDLALTGTLQTDTNNGQQYLNIGSATGLGGITADLEWGSTLRFYNSTITAWGQVVWNYAGVTQPYPYGAPTQYMGFVHTDRFYIKRALSSDTVNSAFVDVTGATMNIGLTAASGTLEYYMRATKNSSENTSTIAEVSIEMKSKPVEAKTRKMKVVWTTEIEQDAKAYHGLDIEKTLTDFLTEHVTLEIDREILHDLYTGYDRRIEETWDYNVSASAQGFYATFEEHHRGILRKMNAVSHRIFVSTKRGPASWAVMSPEVAAIVETLPGMVVDNDGTGNIGNVGITKLGTLSRKWNIFVDPLLSGTERYNKILMGYKGNQVYDAGYIYCPYIIGVMSPVIFDPATIFVPRRGILSRYGKAWIRRDFFGAVIIDNLPSFLATGENLLLTK